MGIVVTVVMLLGLTILRPTPWSDEGEQVMGVRMTRATFVLLLVLGLWNVFWHGINNMDDFWGWAALGSGIVMLLSARIIFLEHLSLRDGFGSVNTSFRTAVVGFLSVFFLLYAVTIVQINMGLPILG
jgi:hypothetical protein